MNVARRLVILSTSPIDKRSVHRFVSIFTVAGQSTCALWNAVPSERLKPGSSLTMHGSARLIEPELVEGSILLDSVLRIDISGEFVHTRIDDQRLYFFLGDRLVYCLTKYHGSVRVRPGKTGNLVSSTLDLRISLSRLRENR